MKIVYLYESFVFLGGVERILIDKMNLLSHEADYTIYALTYNQGNHPVSYELDSRVCHIDLAVNSHLRYRYRGLKKLWDGLKRQYLLYQRLKEQLAAIAPDVIVTTTSGNLAILNNLKGRIPLVVESHEGYDHIDALGLMTWYQRMKVYIRYRQLHHCDVIVSLTENDAKKWRKRYSRVVVIPNLVHLNPTGRLSDVSQKRVIFVGRLNDQKGFPELMAVWRITHLRHPDWSLNLYGKGDNNQLDEMTNGVNAYPPVSDVFVKFCESSILVVTSLWEPFGLVIPEAMSCGLPVISFEADGPNSIISDGEDGYIIRNRDIETFANRLCQLIENKEQRQEMGRKAVASSQSFSAEHILPLWKQLFESYKNSNLNI